MKSLHKDFPDPRCYQDWDEFLFRFWRRSRDLRAVFKPFNQIIHLWEGRVRSTYIFYRLLPLKCHKIYINFIKFYFICKLKL